MTDYEKLLEEVRALGMEYKLARMFVKKLADDEAAFCLSDEEKKWALTKGFYPGRIKLYGLTEENYSQYLSDWCYFMLHPLNHHFRMWVNDKLTLKYILNSEICRETMPRYFLYVENDGTYTYLMDAPEDIPTDGDFIRHLLKKEGCLAIKPNSGTSGGAGFVKLELKADGLYENNKPINDDRFDEIVSNLNNYIVTEYVRQHGALARIWGQSECTLRVVMAKEPRKNPAHAAQWTCTVSYARFGTAMSGGASNLSSGGIGVGFDFETGKFSDFSIRYKKYCPDGKTTLYKHPDSGVVWKDESLPNWDLVKKTILTVCDYISSLSYLGFDVIITENGLKFCEINTPPACDYEQVMCGPVLQKPGARAFFEHKGMNTFNGNDLYEAYMRCQK